MPSAPSWRSQASASRSSSRSSSTRRFSIDPERPSSCSAAGAFPPDAVVRKTLRAAPRRKPRVYVPATVRLIAALHGLAPSLLDWYGERFGIVRG
jgi:hypothetical protein